MFNEKNKKKDYFDSVISVSKYAPRINCIDNLIHQLLKFISEINIKCGGSRGAAHAAKLYGVKNHCHGV